jgi:uncharacterized membrane protein YgcG
MRSRKLPHVLVGASIAGTTALAALGVLGGGVHPERFDAKTVLVARDGETGVRITEYVDIDFGSYRRHGYQRVIPNDFGVPTGVVASSPDAADDLSVYGGYLDTTIRIGDPGATITGQHRYELAYTLPEVRYDRFGPRPTLLLDVVAAAGSSSAPDGDNETGRFEVVVTGYELSDLRCDVGAAGAEGGCELVAAGDGVYRAVLEPLTAGAGLTVGGTIEGFVDPVTVPVASFEERRGDPNRFFGAALFAALGIAASTFVFVRFRRRGRNEVYGGGGAADAAFGQLRAPGEEEDAPSTRLVTDAELGELATIEFQPPSGLAPWEGRALLTEQLGDDGVQAWLSGMIGAEALDVAEGGEHGKGLVLSSGPKRDAVADPDAALLARILVTDPYSTGKYDSKFASAWKAVAKSQKTRIAKRHWWRHGGPASADWSGAAPLAWISVAGVVALGVFGLTGQDGAVVLRFWPVSVVIGILAPLLTAVFGYAWMLPSRSATGSALALRTESFRRFLHASEAQHVEWAWSKGVLREYSAWAVALGEADAWSKALAGADVPEPARSVVNPMILPVYASSLHSSHTAPSSSGGGGGGFSGGGVGGGGGGGSSGSW